MALRATSEDEKEDKNSLTEEWVTRDDRSEREMANLVDQPRVQSGLAGVDEPPSGARKPERQIDKRRRLLSARRSHAGSQS
jgi:hypothetical protein